MKKHKRLSFPAPALLLAVAAPVCTGANLDLSVDPGVPEPRHTPEPRLVNPGLGVAVRDPLLNLALDYSLQAQFDAGGVSSKEQEAQYLGAALNSRRLDKLLGFRTQVLADSFYRHGGGSYLHRVSPGLSRPLAGLATVNLNYEYSLNKPSETEAEQEQQAYSFGLQGSLDGGRLNWSGAWRSAAAQVGQPLARTLQSFNFHSDYQVMPEVKFVLSSIIQQSTDIRADSRVTYEEMHYGAGFSWAPSEHYSMSFAVHHLTRTQTGEQLLLRSGSVNWHPLEDITLTLNYGDQLVEGAPGVLLITELDLGRL